ncbi:hypothetical protein CDAR_99181 [Caerostris darwini]|uniref:Uncharacterized protein n=1 Tax=Caerostris darwini TaxID=1538125 RepID=A0AAV4Q2L9_9ARAC|nr:hypothetical protein CDAR_99181 [Caerostris darwini]
MVIPTAANPFYPNHLTYHLRLQFSFPVQHTTCDKQTTYQLSSTTHPMRQQFSFPVPQNFIPTPEEFHVLLGIVPTAGSNQRIYNFHLYSVHRPLMRNGWQNSKLSYKNQMRTGTPPSAPFSSPSQSEEGGGKKHGGRTLLYHAIGNCNDPYVHGSHSDTVTVLYPLTNFVNSRHRKKLQKLQAFPFLPQNSIDIIEIRRFLGEKGMLCALRSILFFLWTLF